MLPGSNYNSYEQYYTVYRQYKLKVIYFVGIYAVEEYLI